MRLFPSISARRGQSQWARRSQPGAVCGRREQLRRTTTLAETKTFLVFLLNISRLKYLTDTVVFIITVSHLNIFHGASSKH